MAFEPDILCIDIDKKRISPFGSDELNAGYWVLEQRLMEAGVGAYRIHFGSDF
jgi:hypothetical protein